MFPKSAVIKKIKQQICGPLGAISCHCAMHQGCVRLPNHSWGPKQIICFKGLGQYIQNTKHHPYALVSLVV